MKYIDPYTIATKTISDDTFDNIDYILFKSTLKIMQEFIQEPQDIFNLLSAALAGNFPGPSLGYDLRYALGNPKLKMPSPNKKILNDPLFNSIYNAIKTWDISVSESYSGYCHGDGSHAMLIYNEIRKNLNEK